MFKEPYKFKRALSVNLRVTIINSAGSVGRLQQHGVRLRANRMWQELLNARRRESAFSKRNHPAVLRAHLRGHLSGGRHQVPCPRVLPGDIQRRDQGFVGQRHQEAA